MPFYEFRFPDGISKMATGGPKFNTSISTTDARLEQRTKLWDDAELNYRVGFNLVPDSDFDVLLDFFYVVTGQYNGFRFKDWRDYRVVSGRGVFVQLTSTTFQLYKRYTYGGYNFDRKINKPVSGTLAITGGSVSSIDYSTGIVTMTSGTPTSWTGEFDIAARLNSDEMMSTMISKKHFDWREINIVGIKM